MSSGFVPLDKLFLSQVIKNNTNEDGSEKDPRLLARMQNPICQRCHEQYQKKYPNQPFSIKCSGVYDQADYDLKKKAWDKQTPEEPIPIEEVRENYDTVYWAEQYISYKDDDGNIQPFKARWYQEEPLRCTANRKVDRMGRGLGKTITGVIEELHKAFTNQKYEIMVVCPADSQTQKWFTEIKFQISNSPALKASLANSRQQPFKIFEFHNGSTISLFTAGSKSGRGADSVRGQDPRRVRLDEQDYLADKDYQAIMPLVQRHKNSEFHGASTPTGARQMFWEMCVRNPEYKEFYFPASVHPDWSPQREASCIREAKTMDRYRHEFLAEFGDPESGVFKGVFIDVAKKTKYGGMDYKYAVLGRDATRKYFMGVDWNGAGTGTKIRIIEYDPETQKRRVVAKRTVDDPKATMFMSMEAIRDMNRQWRCESVFIDYGFGAAQDEMIREMGKSSDNPLDKNLMKTRVIDFGGTLEFNKLVSARGNSKYINNEDNKFERRTKPFMVDGVVMALESGLFEFSGLPGEDELLEEQMRAYKVKTYSNHGYANTYEAPIVGDHDLDATMLAMLACEMKYGLFQTENTIQKMAHILRTGGFGVPAVSQDGAVTRDPKDARREAAGIPRRNPVATQAQWKTTVTFRNGAFVAPVSRNGVTPAGGIPSRTSVFRNKPKNRGPFGW